MIKKSKEKVIDLTGVLADYQKKAEQGYSDLVKNKNKLLKIFNKITDDIEDTKKKLKKNRIKTNDLMSSLDSQLDDIKADFEHHYKILEEDIRDKKEILSEFRICLFGRTMAGKSTLMEILTQGNGESIGKGSQRTTRDVRKYTWNGLSITDVPGIGAFEGKEDEDVALEAAKSADMIIFLFTDDAIQNHKDGEVEWFDNLQSFGKPMIAVINLKKDINTDDEYDFIKEECKDIFDKKRLTAIKKQFYEFGKSRGKDWSKIKIVASHLQLAWLALNAKGVRASVLNGLSCIDDLKGLICKEILNKGGFYRYRSVADIVIRHLLPSTERLADDSVVNADHARVYIEQGKDFQKFKDRYCEEEKNRIRIFFEEQKNRLYNLANSFAETHYEDENANENWRCEVESYNINRKAEKLFKGMAERMNEKVQEISKKIQWGIKFSDEQRESKVKTETVHDYRFYAKCVGALIGAIGGYLLLESNPVGWVLTGVCIAIEFLSHLFTSKAERIREAKEKLRKQLYKNIDDIMRNVRKKMMAYLHEDVMGAANALSNQIYSVQGCMLDLANAQRAMFVDLANLLEKININLLVEAYNVKNINVDKRDIVNFARIPGFGMLLNVMENDEKYYSVEDLLTDKINLIIGDKPPFALLKNIYKNVKNGLQISYEDKNNVNTIHIHPREQTVDGETRKRLACLLLKSPVSFKEGRN